MTAPYIDVLSGDQTPFFGTPFPSGQIPAGEPGSDLLAFLVGMRATFGFNSTPHGFELDFIPSGTGYGHGASGNLPAINSTLEMQISGFYLKGNVTHADWDSGANGTTLNVILRDTRTTLDQYQITTEDFAGDVPSGVVSIPREWRETYGISAPETRTWDARGATKTELEADDPNFLEYQRIMERGATYPQIVTAIESRLGSGVANKLPPAAEIQPNIGTDINSLRFKFGMQSLRKVMDDVTLDTAFEWYWNMQQEEVELINKQAPFTIPEDKIITIIDGFGGSGIENVKGISYGIDKLHESTRVELLGARQEGMMNSKLLSPIDGLDTVYDGGVTAASGALLFEAAWHMLTVGFYDADGFYRTYIPTEKELQMALLGIEQWSYFKIYQTDPSPSGWSLPADAGSTAAQHPDFQSRLDPRQPISEILNNPDTNIRVIDNRRDIENNWTIEFFSRVAQHASRHYGKSYVSTHGLVYDDRVYTLASEAWCDIENQREDPGQPFVDDYEIDRTYGPMSPFYNTRNNKVAAHCVLPSGTVYGPLGEDSPASFMQWTEDAQPFNPSGTGEHYIPIQLTIVGQRVMDPRRDTSFSFEDFPEGTIWCQLPALAASGIETDDVLGNLATLTELGLQFGQSGIIDLIDPRRVTIPFTYLSGVAVPVVSTERYGRTYPTGWSSGTADPLTGPSVIIEDALSPWAEFPEGSDTSIDKLNRRAFDYITSRRSVQEDAQFVHITQVGLPRISFDTFANQSVNSSGLYGERDHGVNQVNIVYGVGGLETQYKAQSFFVTPRQPGPLEDRTRARLEGVIQPIDFTELGDFIAGLPSTDLSDPDPFGGGGGGQINLDFERQEACHVISIRNIFNEDACDTILAGGTYPSEERYFAEIDRRAQFAFSTQVILPASSTLNIGHTLNSLDVSVIVLPEDNQYQGQPYLALEIDQHTVVVQNPYPENVEATVLISNREGSMRPTNETIRNSEESATEQGVACNDGFLNLGDKCVYVHKRVDGEEFAYLTGGRKFNAGTIVTVEAIEDDSNSYSVSILGDRHGRWICGVTSLNDVALSVGLEAPVEGNTGASMRPGPSTSGFVIIPPGSAGGGIPVEIQALSDPGTSGTLATVAELDASGIATSATHLNVGVLPYGQFAELGEKGVMVTHTPSSGVGVDVKYVMISKSAFLKF
jgi:hypothetical protein